MQEAYLTFAEILSGARIIPLTNGRIAFVDAEDFNDLSTFKWLANKYYAYRYIFIGAKRMSVWMHNQINPPREGFENDHRNNNGFDNRRFNLRMATRSQNLQNRRKPKNNTSGFKGVSFHKGSGRWRAQITVGGVVTSLKYHDSKDEAAAAYAAAVMSIGGEFARID